MNSREAADAAEILSDVTPPFPMSNPDNATETLLPLAFADRAVTGHSSLQESASLSNPQASGTSRRRYTSNAHLGGGRYRTGSTWSVPSGILLGTAMGATERQTNTACEEDIFPFENSPIVPVTERSYASVRPQLLGKAELPPQTAAQMHLSVNKRSQDFTHGSFAASKSWDNGDGFASRKGRPIFASGRSQSLTPSPIIDQFPGDSNGFCGRERLKNSMNRSTNEEYSPLATPASGISTLSGMSSDSPNASSTMATPMGTRSERTNSMDSPLSIMRNVSGGRSAYYSTPRDRAPLTADFASTTGSFEEKKYSTGDILPEAISLESSVPMLDGTNTEFDVTRSLVQELVHAKERADLGVKLILSSMYDWMELEGREHFGKYNRTLDSAGERRGMVEYGHDVPIETEFCVKDLAGQSALPVPPVGSRFLIRCNSWPPTILGNSRSCS